MTIKEREQAFQQGLEALIQRTGISFDVRIVPADTPVPVKPPLVLVQVEGWTEPQPEEPANVSTARPGA